MELLRYTSGMTQAQQNAFYNEFANQKKDGTTGVLLSLFLGVFGGHKFYLGQTKQGVLYALFFWTLVPFFLGLLETALMPGRVQRHNQSLAENLKWKVRALVVNEGALHAEPPPSQQSLLPASPPRPSLGWEEAGETRPHLLSPPGGWPAAPA